MEMLEHVITHLESKKKLTSRKVEVWRARDLMPILGYAEWENFRKVIGNAMESCVKSGMEVPNHFRETHGDDQPWQGGEATS